MNDGNVDLDLEDGELAPGDVIRLKNKYLKSKDHRLMGPRRLISQGWPNHFYVDRVAQVGGEQVVTLWGACCYTLEAKGGAYQCKAHPISLFEKIRPEVAGEDRPKRKGDRTASVVTPLGEVASCEYQDDDENPGLIIKLFGKQFRANGLWLKQVVNMAKERGIL